MPCTFSHSQQSHRYFCIPSVADIQWESGLFLQQLTIWLYSTTILSWTAPAFNWISWKVKFIIWWTCMRWTQLSHKSTDICSLIPIDPALWYMYHRKPLYILIANHHILRPLQHPDHPVSLLIYYSFCLFLWHTLDHCAHPKSRNAFTRLNWVKIRPGSWYPNTKHWVYGHILDLQ